MPPQKVMIQALEQCPDAAWSQCCHNWLQDQHGNAHVRETLLQQATKAVKESKKTQSAKEKDDFLGWIMGADRASLEPVYKAIKSPEQTTLRPYRGKSLLRRAYLRMEFWSHIWDGSLIKAQAEPTSARARLKTEGRTQAGTLPPLQWEDVKNAKTGNKKGGIDCWSHKAVRNLTDQGYQMLTDLFHEMESHVSIPFQLQVVQVALLPKNEVNERPISLTSVLWRIWTKLRRSSLAVWLEDYSRSSGFDSAIPGHTGLDPALAHLIRAEGHKFRGQTFIALFCDLEAFYDVVSHEHLAQQGILLGFPSLMLELAIQLYEGPRYLYGEGVAFHQSGPKGACCKNILVRRLWRS